MAGLLGRPYSGPRVSDPYAQRESSSLNFYERQMPDFAPSMVNTPQKLTDHLDVPSATVRTRASVVSRIPRMDGLQFMWGYGGVNMGGSSKIPTSADNGAVNSSQFQQVLQVLHDYSRNYKWYIVYPNGAAVFRGGNPVRYEYYSMKVPQVSTSTSGGPGPVTQRMEPKPRFTGVQKVSRAIAKIKYYSTLPASNTSTAKNDQASSPIGRVVA